MNTESDRDACYHYFSYNIHTHVFSKSNKQIVCMISGGWDYNSRRKSYVLRYTNELALLVENEQANGEVPK